MIVLSTLLRSRQPRPVSVFFLSTIEIKGEHETQITIRMICMVFEFNVSFNHYHIVGIQIGSSLSKINVFLYPCTFTILKFEVMLEAKQHQHWQWNELIISRPVRLLCVEIDQPTRFEFSNWHSAQIFLYSSFNRKWYVYWQAYRRMWRLCQYQNMLSKSLVNAHQWLRACTF